MRAASFSPAVCFALECRAGRSGESGRVELGLVESDAGGEPGAFVCAAQFPQINAPYTAGSRAMRRHDNRRRCMETLP
jgi:hypothetical protein